MKLNVCNLQDVLKKATLNYMIQSVQLKITEKKIVSNMISASRDAVIMHSMPNDVIEMKEKDDVVLNFSEPNVNIKSYIDLIDEDTADLIIHDSKIKVVSKDQKMTFHFCSPDFVTSYKGEAPTIDSFFYENTITDELMAKFDKIKKIAGKFGKIYFSILGNELFLEATDKTNSFANSMKYSLGRVKHKDISLCFDFKNVNAFLTLVSKRHTDFKIKLHVTDNEEGGMLYFEGNDGSEKYYFVSYSE